MRRSEWLRWCRPGFAEAEALAEIVEAEGVGQGGAVATGAGGVVGLDDLVEDPAGDEEAEDAVFVGQRDEDREDDQVNDALGVLAVVHRADAGDEAEQGGEAGVGFAGRRVIAYAIDIRASREAAGIGTGASGRCACSGEFGGEAGFAEDCSADDAGALLAERLAAVLAEGSTFTIWMVGAVHANPPSLLKDAGIRDERKLLKGRGDEPAGGTASTSGCCRRGFTAAGAGRGLVCFGLLGC